MLLCAQQAKSWEEAMDLRTLEESPEALKSLNSLESRPSPVSDPERRSCHKLTRGWFRKRQFPRLFARFQQAGALHQLEAEDREKLKADQKWRQPTGHPETDISKPHHLRCPNRKLAIAAF